MTIILTVKRLFSSFLPGQKESGALIHMLPIASNGLPSSRCGALLFDWPEGQFVIKKRK